MLQFLLQRICILVHSTPEGRDVQLPSSAPAVGANLSRVFVVRWFENTAHNHSHTSRDSAVVTNRRAGYQGVRLPAGEALLVVELDVAAAQDWACTLWKFGSGLREPPVAYQHSATIFMWQTW